MKCAVLALSLLMCQAGQAPPAEVKKPADQLQGNWAVTTFNGNDVPSEVGAQLVFKGDTYEQWTGTQSDERGSFKLDVTSKPMRIDLIITEGSDAGKTQLGLFEITGDTLTVAFAAPGDTTRPTAISQAELQVILKRSK